MEPKEGETLSGKMDLSWCQPGVAGGPGCGERDCACAWGPHSHLAGHGFGEGQVALRGYEPLDLPGPNSLLNLPLASTNLFLKFKKYKTILFQ